MALKQKKETGHTTLTRRALLIGGAQAAAFGILGWRLYNLQVTQQKEYSLLAEENRISLRLTAPVRGIIYDRFGQKVASSQRNLRIIKKVEKRIATQPKFRPITITEHLSWEDFSNVSVRSADMPGFYPDVGNTRLYHHPVAFSHVLGHVGAVNETETGNDPLLLLPGFKIGKNGIERSYEK